MAKNIRKNIKQIIYKIVMQTILLYGAVGSKLEKIRDEEIRVSVEITEEIEMVWAR